MHHDAETSGGQETEPAAPTSSCCSRSSSSSQTAVGSSSGHDGLPPDARVMTSSRTPAGWVVPVIRGEGMQQKRRVSAACAKPASSEHDEKAQKANVPLPLITSPVSCSSLPARLAVVNRPTGQATGIVPSPHTHTHSPAPLPPNVPSTTGPQQPSQQQQQHSMRPLLRPRTLHPTTQGPPKSPAPHLGPSNHSGSIRASCDRPPALNPRLSKPGPTPHLEPAATPAAAAPHAAAASTLCTPQRIAPQ